MHAGNWRVLHAASELYIDANKYGYIIAGQFERGNHRGGGEYANAQDRDRVRAIQLELLAIGKSGDAQPSEKANLYRRLSDYVINNRQNWRLQELTDVATLPDYERGYNYYGYGNAVGAPVDAQGNPIYYAIPKTWGRRCQRRRALALGDVPRGGIQPGLRVADALDLRKFPV